MLDMLAAGFILILALITGFAFYSGLNEVGMIALLGTAGSAINSFAAFDAGFHRGWQSRDRREAVKRNPPPMPEKP